MESSLDRRRLLRGSLLAAGVAAPLVAFADAAAVGAAPQGDGQVSALDGGAAPSIVKDSPITISAVPTGVQFTGTLQAFQTGTWFTFNWPASWHVIWHAVSTTPRSGVIQVDSTWDVERASVDFITYWVAIRNISNAAINIEARYAILNL